MRFVVIFSALCQSLIASVLNVKSVEVIKLAPQEFQSIAAKFNSFARDYFKNVFGENGLKYLESIFSPSVIGCPNWTSDQVLVDEVEAVNRAFEGGSWFTKHKSTNEVRYRVHRVVGMFHYLITHNCLHPNARDSMNYEIKKFRNLVFSLSLSTHVYRYRNSITSFVLFPFLPTIIA